MFKKWFGGKRVRMEREPQADPECVAVREEIVMAVYSESGAGVESVSVHIERCESCRAWEAEVRKMRRGSREPGAPGDISRLTLSALGIRATESPSAAGRRPEPRREAKRPSDRGALLVVSLAALLFNLILASRLEGGSRVLYPSIGFAVMIASALWVYVDSTRRKMPAAFWAALQPFTIPVGLIAYLVCRERASLRCPSCGRTVPVRDRFCPECGKGLAAFCCGCGRSVRKEFRVCPFCGTRLENCFPREDEGGKTCGWSRAQIVLLAVANVVLFAGFLAALLRGGTETALAAAFLYPFGFFPIFNWVSFDSRRRAMSTMLWGILALVTLYAGLVIYLACRKDERLECPVCGSYPPASFNFCPCCGSMLGASCPSCGAASRGDRFCASCGAEMLSAAASPPSPE
ncbi:MAG: zinc ribbon domain-containing protein [Candidatus Krumholzibacteria bacterium]|nr:zinc ribbon domain-containing protein [Candidatus Krumholzibacteria bacterium]